MSTVLCGSQGRLLDCRNPATTTIEVPDPDYPGAPDEVAVCQPCADDATIRARVWAGADWLDINIPDWLDRIDVDNLSLRSTCYCILGQLDDSRPRYDGDFATVATLHHLTDDQVIQFGFASEQRELYAALTEAWRELITARRAEAVTA